MNYVILTRNVIDQAILVISPFESFDAAEKYAKADPVCCQKYGYQIVKVELMK